MTTPTILNEHFKVDSYNGGSQGDMPEYQVMNIFGQGRPHCSAKGSNFDLVLEYTKGDSFTLTNIVIHPPRGCTCPLKTAAFWISDQKPDIDNYSAKYNNFKADATTEFTGAQEPFVVVVTKGGYGEVNLSKPKTGKYLHIKFINCDQTDDDVPNIDVGWLPLVGFDGNAPSGYVAGSSVPAELECARRKLNQSDVNPLHPDYLDHIRSSPACFLFLNGANEQQTQQLLDAVKPLAADAKYNQKLAFFSADAENQLGAQILGLVGLSDSKPGLAILNLSTDAKYAHDASKDITPQSAAAFVQAYADGTLPKHVKSAPRPPNDRHPEHPNLVVVTASSFDEIVLDTNKDVFLDVYADWCGPCQMVGPTIVLLADVLKDTGIVVAKLDCDVNDVNRHYLPERGIPNMKLFPKGDKEKWVKYSGNRTLEDFVNFVHQHAANKFDLEAALKRASELAELLELRSNAEELLSSVATAVSAVGSQLPADEKAALDDAVEKLKQAAKNDDKTGLTDGVKSLEEKRTHLEELFKKYLQDKEAQELKRVKKVHSEEEFKQHMEDAKAKNQLVVIDWFATWCGPCKRIAPLFGDLSEENPDVLFLKVDVDELEGLSQSEGISCMPTFHFVKGGEKVATVEGASVAEIKENLAKFK